MTTNDPATCLHCLEPMRPGARRCPKCLSWQSKWAADSQNPRLEVAIIVIGIGLLAAMLLVLLQQQNREIEPAEGITRGFEALVVDEVECVPVQYEIYRYVSVVGKVENPTGTEFSGPFFYVRFYDDSDVLIDVVSLRDYALVIPANGSARFKIGDRWLTRDADEYARCEVELTWASPRL